VSVSPLLDLDILDRQAELLGQDLGKRGLVALALALHADPRDRRAGGVDTHLAAIEHLEAQDVEGVRGTSADDLGERRDADAHQLALSALLGLLLAQLPVADPLHR
jgi:hypothetical protein